MRICLPLIALGLSGALSAVNMSIPMCTRLLDANTPSWDALCRADPGQCETPPSIRGFLGEKLKMDGPMDRFGKPNSQNFLMRSPALRPALSRCLEPLGRPLDPLNGTKEIITPCF